MIPQELLALIEREADAVAAYLPVIIGVVARMSAIAFLAPGFGEQATPARVRLAAVIALSMIVAPPIMAAAPPGAPGVSVFAVIGAEAMIGLLIGFALRLAIFVLQMTGTIAAQHISMSQLFGPGLSHDQETPLSTILIMAGLAIAASNDVHVALAVSLTRSYEIFPFGVLPAAADVGEWAANESGEALALAFALAAPFVVIGFLYTLALTAMSRAMPQLMATFVGAPAIIFAGLVLFAGTASVMLDRWGDRYAALIDRPFEDGR